MSANGRIKVIIGPMFSGKTTAMYSAVERYSLADKHCVILRYAGDTRSEELYTHDGMSRRGIKVISGDTVDPGTLADYDVIGIDEVQFFGNVVDSCTQLAASGKIIIACGLDADHARRPFGCVPQLIAAAEDVVKLAAVCKCGADAAFTLRTVEATEIVLIGGKDKYRPVCRACYERARLGTAVARIGPVEARIAPSETKKNIDV